MIKRLRNYNNFLSNSFACKIEYDGFIFTNVESALESAKAKDLKDKQLFAGLGPSRSRFLGNKIESRQDWDLVKEKVLYDILYAKFNQNENLKSLLLDTRDEDIYNSRILFSTNDIKLNEVICDIIIKVRGNIMG